MLKQVLSTPYFYFSYNFDISHSRQRLDQLKSNEFLSRSLYISNEFNAFIFHLFRSLIDRIEKRFVWNVSLLEPLMKDPSFHRSGFYIRFFPVRKINSLSGTVFP